MDDYELKSRPMSRGNSLFGSDPQAQLLTALHQNEFRTFCRILKSAEVDIDHCYGYPDRKTCLDIACSDPKLHQFVKVLIENEADVNRINKSHKKAPIHFAVEKGDIKILKELLRAKNLDINALSVQNTALHLAIKQINKIKDDESIKRMEEMIKLLLTSGIDPNIPDMKNNTPIHSAANQGLESIIKLILESSDNIDLDTFQDEDDESARDVLKRLFPHLLITTKDSKAGPIDIFKLCSHLSNHDEEKFLNDFSKIKNKQDRDKILTENNGLYTLLQFACDKGMDRIVSKLLDSGADPNLTAPGYSISPVTLACSNGYHKVLKHLDSNESTSFESINGDSLLQIVVKGGKTSDNDDNDNNINYEECRKILLSSKKCKPDINFTDIKGSTALHYATKSGNQDVVLDLLRNGAYIGTWNKFGEPPLIDMSASTFESYLDECITTNSEQPFDDDYEINFKYDFLVPPSTKLNQDTSKAPLMNKKTDDIEAILTPETDILLYMTKHPEFKPLLAHPVITSFLYLKWQRVSCLFYANITFYTTFWLSLLIYIMLVNNNSEVKSDSTQVIIQITKYLTIIGTIILSVRELFQAIVSPRRYFVSIANWIEIALIVITFNIILNDYIGTNIKQQLCAVAILLSSAEFILLIGCFPPFSTNIEMLKTVSWNFFKFLLWYCILIIAFALSFYTLFRAKKKEEEDSEKTPYNPNKADGDEDKETDFFVDPGMSLFKTIVMLIGELDAGSIQFDNYPVTSHMIFVVFVFVIPIVLFNLLNGLAVSDTQAIRADAELVGHISRVRLISYFESVFLGDMNMYKNTISKLHNACCCLPGYTCISPRLICIRPLAKRICLFPHFLSTAQISVKVNQSSSVQIPVKKHTPDEKDPETTLCCLAPCKNLYMDKKVMKAAKNVITERRGEKVNLKKVQLNIVNIEQRMQDLEKQLNLIYNCVKK